MLSDRACGDSKRFDLAGRCPCGYTDTWTGWGPLILGAIETRNEEMAEASPRCPRCGGLVPRLTIGDLQALVRDLEP